MIKERSSRGKMCWGAMHHGAHPHIYTAQRYRYTANLFCYRKTSLYSDCTVGYLGKTDRPLCYCIPLLETNTTPNLTCKRQAIAYGSNHGSATDWRALSCGMSSTISSSQRKAAGPFTHPWSPQLHKRALSAGEEQHAFWRRYQLQCMYTNSQARRTLLTGITHPEATGLGLVFFWM